MNLDLEVRNCSRGCVRMSTTVDLGLRRLSSGDFCYAASISAAGTGLVRQLSVHLCGAADASRLLSL